MPISLNLDKSSREALLAIRPIVEEIISNPDVATEFGKDPNAFCEKYGLNYNFKLDDALYNVIVALGDYEVNDALKDNDFERFMNACEKLHLFDKAQSIQLNSIFQSEDEQMIFESIASQINVPTSTRSVAMWVAVSVVVVLAIVVVLTIGMSASNNEEKTVADYNLEQNKDSSSHVLSYLRSANSSQSVLDIWALKQSKITEFQVVAQYKQHLANKIVNYLKVHSPQTFERFSETQINEFLKRNMIV